MNPIIQALIAFCTQHGIAIVRSHGGFSVEFDSGPCKGEALWYGHWIAANGAPSEDQE